MRIPSLRCSQGEVAEFWKIHLSCNDAIDDGKKCGLGDVVSSIVPFFK